MGIKNRVGDQKEGADESPLVANRKLCSRNNPCKKKRKIKKKEAREDKLKSESKLEQTGLERELVSSSLFFFFFCLLERSWVNKAWHKPSCPSSMFWRRVKSTRWGGIYVLISQISWTRSNHTTQNVICGFLCQPWDTCLWHWAVSHKALKGKITSFFSFLWPRKLYFFVYSFFPPYSFFLTHSTWRGN